jgi:hypothetical protein
MRNRGGTRWLVAAVALAALLVPAGVATAQERPTVHTGAATNRTPSTATLTGWVNPQGGATSYFFQIGPTSLFGAQTATASAGAGNARVAASALATGLAPDTVYHYRIVATKGSRIVRGERRTFRTRKQPLGLGFVGSPNPVRAGGSTTLSGALSGTGNNGRQVVLQANPFPYTQGFQTVADPHVTSTTGGFSFPILSVPVNTQFRVLLASRPEIASPIVVVGASVRVTTRTSTQRGRRSGTIRFRGTISPAVDGEEVQIQRQRGDEWVVVGRTFARNAGASRSRYTKRIRQRSGGRFRVVAAVDGAYMPSAGSAKRIRVRR